MSGEDLTVVTFQELVVKVLEGGEREKTTNSYGSRNKMQWKRYIRVTACFSFLPCLMQHPPKHILKSKELPLFFLYIPVLHIKWSGGKFVSTHLWFEKCSFWSQEMPHLAWDHEGFCWDRAFIRLSRSWADKEVLQSWRGLTTMPEVLQLHLCQW